MNKIPITMPDGIRYMSDAANCLQEKLPLTGKYILDKTLTGCGGTEFFINSGRPIVLISPRTGVLINKSKQHPEVHLFRDSDITPLPILKQNLSNYLDTNQRNPVILTTLDSAKYVIAELKLRNRIDDFLFLTDEFQCLIGDAAFKGNIDYDFLRLLDAEAKSICYMSATPIDDTYLDGIPEFKNVEYYKLDWDPAVVVEPTVKEVMMKAGESPCTIFSKIIKDYRSKGYFARKYIQGREIQSKEAVVFVNEVKTIIQIIKSNNLSPAETTILVSNSNKEVDKLKKAGFTIGGENTDRNNPKNKTFTFCSKASFEGRDFYSLNAFTYIFIDGSKDWQTQDIGIEIPQILGRQRMDENPFKYNAKIYYRTKPNTLCKQEYMKIIAEKCEGSQALLNVYDSGDEKTKKALIGLVKKREKNNPYEENYLDIVNHSNGSYSLAMNYLVAAAEHNLWMNKEYFYSNPIMLACGIQSQMSIYNTKPAELRDFEKRFNSAKSPNDKMRIYCDYLSKYPYHIDAILANPFIERMYHEYYDALGYDTITSLGYDIIKMDEELKRRSVSEECRKYFITDSSYSADKVKLILQGIYDAKGYNKKASATHLSSFISCTTYQPVTPDGKRPICYKIL